MYVYKKLLVKIMVIVADDKARQNNCVPVKIYSESTTDEGNAIMRLEWMEKASESHHLLLKHHRAIIST